MIYLLVGFLILFLITIIVVVLTVDEVVMTVGTNVLEGPDFGGESKIRSNTTKVIESNWTVEISTGIKFNIPEGVKVVPVPMHTKDYWIVPDEIVSGKEVTFDVYNSSDEAIVIRYGTPLAKLILVNDNGHQTTVTTVNAGKTKTDRKSIDITI